MSNCREQSEAEHSLGKTRAGSKRPRATLGIDESSVGVESKIYAVGLLPSLMTCQVPPKLVMPWPAAVPVLVSPLNV